VTSLPELVALLYRADWTQLSMSAARLVRPAAPAGQQDSAGAWPPLAMREHVRLMTGGNWPALEPDWARTRQRILLAPGGRYRIEVAGPDGATELTVSDGISCWVVDGGAAFRYDAEPALAPAAELLRPAWLLSRFTLAEIGPAQAAGQAAVRVTAAARLPAGAHPPKAERLDLLIDAETGMVLRTAPVPGGAPYATTELRDRVMDPPEAQDPAMFRPPAGVPEKESGGPAEFLTDRHRRERSAAESGPLARTGSIGASLAAGAVRLAATQAARPEPRADDLDPEAAMPAADPADLDAGPGRLPVSDDLLNLIARTGLPPQALRAEFHHWVENPPISRAYLGITVGSGRAQVDFLTGFCGTGWDPDIFGDMHRSARLQVEMPGRYRIDYQADDRARQPRVAACDGDRLRRLYHNRMVAGPAQPLEPAFARLIDPAWLLEGWELAAAGEAILGGRRAVRVIADLPRWARERDRAAASCRIVLLIDAELGVVLRQVSYVTGVPAVRLELRDLTTDPSGFRIAVPPGLPVIESGGGPLDDLDLPAPAQAAGAAATTLLRGATAAAGWLQRRRTR
jgi:hypothetical protein